MACVCMHLHGCALWWWNGQSHWAVFHSPIQPVSKLACPELRACLHERSNSTQQCNHENGILMGTLHHLQNKRTQCFWAHNLPCSIYMHLWQVSLIFHLFNLKDCITSPFGLNEFFSTKVIWAFFSHSALQFRSMPARSRDMVQKNFTQLLLASGVGYEV